MMLTVGSLFSGIGGIELGLERTGGFKTIWQAEIEPFPSNQILPKHWKDVPNIGDVTKGRWLQYERPDLLCGGFPCQPVSLSGRRLAQEDPRWLWPIFSQGIRILGPRYILVENVPGLLSSGMGDVLGDLADLGYDAEWQSIPAAFVGAPHLRYRVFIVAYPNGKQWVKGAEIQTGVFRKSFQEEVQRFWSDKHHGRISGRLLPAIPPEYCRMDDGFPTELDEARLKALGNAVVPQVAQWIGEQILRFDKEVSH